MQLLIEETIEICDAKFRVRGLTGIEFLEVQAELENAAPTAPTAVADARIQLTGPMVKKVLVAVEGWEGVTGPDGAPLQFNPANRKKLPLPHNQKLVGAILDKAILSEDAEKN